MRVLHLAPRLSERGGADQHLLSLLRLLDGKLRQELWVGRREDGVSSPCPVQLLPGLDSPRAAVCDLATLQPDADLVHVHNVVNPHCLQALSASGLPWIFTLQDHRFFCPGRGKWTLDGRVCRKPMDRGPCAACFEEAGYFHSIFDLTTQRLGALRRASGLHVLSRYMADELEAVGLDRAGMHVIPPHVDLPPAVGPEAPRDRILFAGRLVAAKGVRDALEAWRLSGLDWPLVFVGTGSARKELEAEGLRVTGWLDRPSLAAELARARALIFPSRWQEPYGILGVEALAHGVPVVAWDSGGVAEWHPGPLSAWGQVDELARSLVCAVDGGAPVLRSRWGPDQARSAWLELYASL